MSVGVTLLDGLTVRCVGSALSVRFAAHLLGQLGADVTSHAPDRARSEYRYPWAEAVAQPPRPSTGRTVNVVAAADLQEFDVAAGLERGESAVWISADDTDDSRLGDPLLDLLVAHAGGYGKHLVWSSDDPDGDPPRRGVPDQMALLTGVVAAIVTSAIAASGTTTPAAVLVSARDVAASLLLPELGDLNSGELTRARSKLVGGSKVAGGLVGLLATADGYVIISPREQHQWDRLTLLIGDDELTGDPRFATVAQRQAGWEELQPVLEARWSRAQTAEAVFRSCQERKVACFPLRSVDEMLADDHLRAREFWVDQAGVRAPGLPFRVLATAPPANSR